MNNGKEEEKSREAEGARTTSIRPVSLRRAQIIAPYLDGESITDFVSSAVDDRARTLVKRLGIKLPPDVAFTS